MSEPLANRSATGRGSAAVLLGAFLLCVSLFWLLAAQSPQGPLVLADEFVYWARGLGLDAPKALNAAEPALPQVGDYLFLRLVNLIDRAGLATLVTLRTINVIAFAAALGLLSRLAGGTSRAVPLLLLFAVLPLGAYATYLMPESLYFLGFTALFFGLAKAPRTHDGLAGLVSGGLVGLLTLTKAHGLFALVALIVATLLWGLLVERRGVLEVGRRGLLIGLGFGATVVVGVLVLGPHGPGRDGGLVGDFYLDMLRRAAPSPARVAAAARLTLADAVAVFLLLAPSLTFLAAAVAAPRMGPPVRGASADVDPLAEPAVFLFVFWALIIVSVAYLLSDVPRLQLRYLDFSFPCALALAWRGYRQRPELATVAFRQWAATLWLVAAVAFVLLPSDLRPMATDAPDLYFRDDGDPSAPFGLGGWTPAWVVGVVAMGCGLLWRTRLPWTYIQLAVMAALSLPALADTLHWQARWSQAQAPRRALGMAAARSCAGPSGSTLALGPTPVEPELFTAMAQLPAPAVWRERPNATFAAQLKSGRGCVLSVFDLAPLLGAPTARAGDLALYRVRTPWRAVWRDAFNRDPRTVRLGAGWSQPEATGRWSDGPKASLTLPAQPDGAGVAAFDAFGFTPPGLANQPVAVTWQGRLLARWIVTDGTYFVGLPASASPIELMLSLPGARSPASSIAGAQDRRQLGVGVRTVTLLRPGPPPAAAP